LTADPATSIQQTSSFDDFLFCMCFEMKLKDSLEQRQTSWEAGNLRHPSYLDATLSKSLQEFGSFDRLNVLATAPISSVEEDIKDETKDREPSLPDSRSWSWIATLSTSLNSPQSCQEISRIFYCILLEYKACQRAEPSFMIFKETDSFQFTSAPSFGYMFAPNEDYSRPSGNRNPNIRCAKIIECDDSSNL
jgi:hypothetical protein